MSERLVDISSPEKTLHTFPITIGSSDDNATPGVAEYEEKALKAAAHAQLVPDAELGNLTASMHVSRSGPLEPYGDDLGVLSQTKQGLDQAVRTRAYFLWKESGCPRGRSDEFWHHAYKQHLSDRAYVLWQQEGCPEGRADEHWHQIKQFELH
jgi:hypothetical protein